MTGCASRRRRWACLVPVATILVAGAWALAAWRIGSHVKSVSLSRLVVAVMTGSIVPREQMGPLPRNPLLPFTHAAPPEQAGEAAELAQQLRRQIPYVEGVVHVWQRGMYGVAGVLAIVGLFSLATGKRRWPHLLAAILLLASPAATLVAMRRLMDPEGGGLNPLSIWTSVIVVLVQSGYGWVLLVAFARRPRPSAAPPG